MKLPVRTRDGLTLVELMITIILVGVLGLVIYSLLNTGTVLGAKNTAVNTAHQQARSALLQMTQTLHSAVSVPELIDVNSNRTNIAPAAGIAFQLWAGGPYKITADTADAWQSVTINATAPPTPQVGQRVIIPTYGVESNITAVSGTAPGIVTLTLTPPTAPPPAPASTPVPITGTTAPTNYNVPCFITERCSYIVDNGALQWRKPWSSGTPFVIARGINTAVLPFTLSNSAVSIALSTYDTKSSNRGFKSTTVDLKETVSIRSNNPPLATLP